METRGNAIEKASGEEVSLRLILQGLNDLENRFLRLEESSAEETMTRYMTTLTLASLRASETQQPHSPHVGQSQENLDFVDAFHVREEDDGSISSVASEEQDDSEAVSSRTSLPLTQDSDAQNHDNLHLVSEGDIDLIFRPAVSVSDIADVEQILNTRLPSDYRQFLQLTNGLKHFPSRSDPGLRILHDHSTSRLRSMAKSSTKLDWRPIQHTGEDHPGLYWQKVQDLGSACPALRWFPRQRTMIKISNWDDESLVWLITSAGMKDARLHDRKKLRQRERDDCESDMFVESSVEPQGETIEPDWGVLRWTKPQTDDMNDESRHGSKCSYDRPSSQAIQGEAFVYSSFMDYLSALLDSLETAYNAEIAEIGCN